MATGEQQGQARTVLGLTAAPSYHAHELRIESPYKELRGSVGINLGDAMLLLCSGLMSHFLFGGHVTVRVYPGLRNSRTEI